MRAVADKRSAFAQVDVRALERIDVHVPKRERAGVRNMLLTLCQVATIEMAARDRVFDASRRLLMEKGSVSENTLDKHLGVLEALGLVEVESRVAAHGGGLPNRYALVDSPEPGAPIAVDTSDRNGCPPVAIAGGVNECPPAIATPGHGVAQPLPPLRARPEAVKKEEEREREGERADEGIVCGSGESTAEQGVLAELTALLADRGQQLTARQRLAVRSALGAAAPGVDVAAAAARLRRNYGPGGKAAHRRIGDVVAVLIAEIKQSTAARPAAERSSRRRLRSASIEPRSQIPEPWRIHDARPLDPPDRFLSEAWRRARQGLRGDNSSYCWDAILQPVRLAGCYVTEIEDRDGSREQPVIVVEAPADVVEQVAEAKMMRAIVAWLEDALGEEGIIVELSRASSENVAVAA